MSQEVLRNAALALARCLALVDDMAEDELLGGLEEKARRPSGRVPVDAPPGGSGVRASTPASSSAREFATHMCPQTHEHDRPFEETPSRSSRIGYRRSFKRVSSYPWPQTHWPSGVRDTRSATSAAGPSIELTQGGRQEHTSEAQAVEDRMDVGIDVPRHHRASLDVMKLGSRGGLSILILAFRAHHRDDSAADEHRFGSGSPPGHHGSAPGRGVTMSAFVSASGRGGFRRQMHTSKSAR